MTNTIFNPKLEIIKYFDELIHQVDIDIEDALKNYNENQVLGDLECFEQIKLLIRHIRYIQFNTYTSLFESSENNSNEHQTVELWSESTKVVDYLNQVRMRTIEELKKAQDETFEYYTLNSSRFNYMKEMKDEEKLEELKSQLFAKKFYFQVGISNKKYNPCIFNLFTFVTDFYLSPSDIDFLKMLINNKNNEKIIGLSKTSRNTVFDEKMLLISLLASYFNQNLINLKYPNHVMSVKKRDVKNIKQITIPKSVREVKFSSSMDLSNLERLTLPFIDELEDIELEGFSSIQYLNISLYSIRKFLARNLTSLKHLVLNTIDLNENMSRQIFGNLPNIKELEINGGFSDINLDYLVYLEKLSFSGNLIGKNFNFGLFKNLCDNLKKLSIHIRYINDKDMSKLFYGYNFPNLVKLDIKFSQITKLEKELFESFPMLQSLIITNNYKLRNIESDSFSGLTNLVHLDLSWNRIQAINQRHFSLLTKLETLDLSSNRIKCIENNSFSNLKNLKKLELSSNNLPKLNPKLFASLENLENLNLNLREFDGSIFRYISNIKKIALSLIRFIISRFLW